MFEGVDFCL
jgi:small-conductance mechanosensitive channel